MGETSADHHGFRIMDLPGGLAGRTPEGVVFVGAVAKVKDGGCVGHCHGGCAGNICRITVTKSRQVCPTNCKISTLGR